MIPSKLSLYERSRSRFTALVFVGDLAVVFICLVLGHFIRFQYFSDFRPTGAFPDLWEYWNHFCLGLLGFVALSHNQQLYRWTVMLSRARTAALVVRLALLWSFSVTGLALILGFTPQLSRFYVVCTTVLMVLALCAWRFMVHGILHNSPWFAGTYRRVAVVGTGTIAQDFAQRVRQGRCGLLRFSGFVSTPNSTPDDQSTTEGQMIGALDQLETLMVSGQFDSVAVVDVDLPRSQLVRIAKLCEMHFIDFKAVPKSFEVFASCLQIHNVGGLPLMGLSEVPQRRMLNRAAKRCIDIAGSFVGLLISVPLYCVLVPMIKRESPGPVFYKQVRVGQAGKEFFIYKLRSMRVDAESNGKVGWSTQEDPRRTKIGTFMRKWNLDEIPQFWNVLRGDMSLVGPRPERPELIVDFIKEIPYYQSRHMVKPGITGWAQVHGLRGDTSIAERIRYDLQYIENWSVWMDLTIKFKTFFNYKGAC